MLIIPELDKLHSNILFLLKRMKIDKYQNPMFNLCDKENWHTHKSSEADIGSFSKKHD